MQIELKVENGKVLVFCNGEKLACSWFHISTQGNENEAVDLIYWHCREQLIKELQELKDA